MDMKPLLGLLVLSLVSSYILSSTAIPTPRSLMSIEEDPSTTSLQAQAGGIAVNNNGKLVEMGEEESEKAKMELETREYRGRIANRDGVDVKGRMEAEIADYDPTGPNHGHDPPHPSHA